MSICLDRDGVTIHNGDCLEVLRTIPDQSVQCCVTSPPYWGLRDYGHDGQIGLEATPEAYVGRMVEVFREVRRVLREDGTLWLNLGDSYCSTGGHTKQGDTSQRKGRSNVEEQHKQKGANSSKWRLVQNERHDCTMHINSGDGRTLCGKKCDGQFWLNCSRVGETINFDCVDCGACRDRIEISPPIKTKDLVGIPWRVAFALQADGWYLRQDIIWHKPNPMPESVTDRCTKAHEYVFLLAKSPRYYYDAAAISEEGAWCGKQLGIVRGRKVRAESMGRNPSGNEVPGADATAPARRNRRSVWTVCTKPYSGAHFAVMPPDLVKPCILAGCPEGGIVLDPFMGSGTVAAVAQDAGRRAIGIELNPEYCKLIATRFKQRRIL